MDSTNNHCRARGADPANPALASGDKVRLGPVRKTKMMVNIMMVNISSEKGFFCFENAVEVFSGQDFTDDDREHSNYVLVYGRCDQNTPEEFSLLILSGYEELVQRAGRYVLQLSAEGGEQGYRITSDPDEIRRQLK